uniref:condensation domain-containing protein n=1 Tax=Dyadobacter diqingensis TaxID=2938121 RepID=UPI0020C5934C
MIKGPFPLHNAQLDVFIDQILDIRSPHYNIGGYSHLVGHLDIDLFDNIVTAIPQSFDSFKIRVDFSDPHPGYYIDLDFTRCSLVKMDFSEKEFPLDYAKEWMKNQFNIPFTFDINNPLCEQFLIKIGQFEFIYFFKYHHLITDGIGISITNEYIADMYKGVFSNGTFGGFYPSYHDEAQNWSTEYQTQKYQDGLIFWRSEIRKWPQIDFLSEKKNLLKYPTNKTERFAVEIESDLRLAIEHLKSDTKSSLQCITIAALTIYFGKVLGNTEFVFGTSLHRRRSPLQRRIVGLFSGSVPITSVYAPKERVTDLLRSIKVNQTSVFRRQNFSISDLNQAFRSKSFGEHFFDVVVNYAHLDFHHDFGNDLKSSTYELVSEAGNIPLRFWWSDYGEQQLLRLSVDYSLRYFTGYEISLLSERLLYILSQFSDNFDGLASDIDIILPSERVELLSGFNDTFFSYPSEKTVVDLF